MARRNQFKGICHDLLETFVSRYNDLNGYWALGQYQAYVLDKKLEQLDFDLIGGTKDMDASPFADTITYYRGAVFRLMRANAMADAWMKKASITFKSTGPEQALCATHLTCDLDKVFRHEQLVEVRRHDPLMEYRRGAYGPSNQKGQ
ncbi:MULTISPECIES: hypothetical protein [unclassified Rhizobium]|uniref:hypothetical protein n=1 Tax=unclassified Rhizobium TaxID=2613769 RepID=UPI0006F706EF|nr:MULTISPECIES: hypothetical protein [unclassified Rhizobium]KQV39128.1 hypothetical protein ASC86_22920 [Rhizobium sp. Root1212]KRD35102.1 hypothetical protein ASE37_21490 [Rhizobium sp. Root268]